MTGVKSKLSTSESVVSLQLLHHFSNGAPNEVLIFELAESRAATCTHMSCLAFKCIHRHQYKLSMCVSRRKVCMAYGATSLVEDVSSRDTLMAKLLDISVRLVQVLCKGGPSTACPSSHHNPSLFRRFIGMCSCATRLDEALFFSSSLSRYSARCLKS